MDPYTINTTIADYDKFRLLERRVESELYRDFIKDVKTLLNNRNEYDWGKSRESHEVVDRLYKFIHSDWIDSLKPLGVAEDLEKKMKTFSIKEKFEITVWTNIKARDEKEFWEKLENDEGENDFNDYIKYEHIDTDKDSLEIN